MSTPPQGSVDAMSALHAALVKELPHHCPAGWRHLQCRGRLGEAQNVSMQPWHQSSSEAWDYVATSFMRRSRHTALCRRACALAGPPVEPQPPSSSGRRDAGGWH
jgi:hypothetical protein